MSGAANRSWGYKLVWPCHHAAYLLDPNHNLWHPHYCPLCEPEKRESGCDVEFLDVHVEPDYGDDVTRLLPFFRRRRNSA